MITLFSIFITISAYFFSRHIGKRFSSPLTTPVFLSTLLVILMLLVLHISYDDYTPAKGIMTYLLGPSTVALAVPIYRNRGLIGKYKSAALFGLLIGLITTIASAMLLAKILHLSKSIFLSLSVKSVTVPVATEVGKVIKGDPALIAAVVIITGMIGAMFAPKLLSLFKVTHPFARGLAMGTISHGIGTAEAVKEGEIQGAVAGAAMGIAALLTSFIIPYLIPYII